MSKVKIKEGSLLDATETYICHQCNCLTRHSVGLAKEIFDRFTHANIYKDREKDHIPCGYNSPGNIIVMGGYADSVNPSARGVINMLGQFYPGKVKYESVHDGARARRKFFKNCLKQITWLGDFSVAFPWKIGCSMAGGDWEDYLSMIEDFAKIHQGEVTIYKHGRI